MKRFAPTVLLFASLSLTGCGGPSEVPEEVNKSSNVIYVSIPPLAELAQEIAADAFEVRAIVQPGEDPHSFSPSAKQLIDISQSRAVFTLGMPFQRNLENYLSETAPGIEIVNLQEGIELIEVGESEHEGHDHSHNHGECEDSADIHTWLSPALLKKQLVTLSLSLQKFKPDQAAVFTAASSRVEARIDNIDSELQQRLSPLSGRAIYVHHAAFGYFASHYGIKQESVEMGGRAPSAKRVSDLIEKAKAEGVTVIFTQPQFDPSSAEKIAESIGGTVVPMDPLAADLLGNLKAIADAIAAAHSS